MRYRYHWFFKLLALILAIAAGATIMLGCAGLILDDLGYYQRNRESQLYRNVSSFSHQAADAVFDRFAWEGTDIEPRFFERFFHWGADVDAVDHLPYDFYYEIRSQKTGELVAGNCRQQLEWHWANSYVRDVQRGYVTEMPKSEYYPAYGEFTQVLETTGGPVYVDLEGKALPPLGEGVQNYEYYVLSDDESVNWENVSTELYSHAEAGGAEYTVYRMEYTGYETYLIDIYMTEEQVSAMLDTPMDREFLPMFLEEHHALLGPMVGWGLAALIVALLWLALTAGKSPYKEGVKPEGLNVIPLDLYLVGVGFAAVGLAWLSAAAMDQITWNSVWGNYDGNGVEQFYFDLALLALSGMGAGGVVALFIMACAAQMKAGDNFWVKNSLVGLSWKWGRIVLKESLLGIWKIIKGCLRWIGGVCRRIGEVLRRFGQMLPLSWQWLIASGCAWLLMLFCLLCGMSWYSPVVIIFGILVTVGLVLYGSYCFGALRSAAKEMASGRLESKITDKFLLGCFQDFANDLNALGDTCVDAAKRQMKSERMKSELITNVSHDIKTPLTSIINYVDLLQKAETEDQKKEYLEVLDRQSQRLKKLIEDLMEMSKASSGNVAAEIVPTDVAEAVNQALGEYADALERCNLSVVTGLPKEPLMALCDGKLLWRVLNNCFSNTVKYALRGTRVYVDAARRDDRVELSVKNISAKMLNITADELMERFVRGDESRNTEGNGLGLNIAKSLMEVQGGTLSLMVDGDLFKVVLTLPADSVG